jgi:hypothetical protein
LCYIKGMGDLSEVVPLGHCSFIDAVHSYKMLRW